MNNDLVFYKTGEHPCSYLPGQMAQTLFLDPDTEHSIPVIEWLNLMGFRRSGKQVYRPECGHCKACESSRVVVDDFVWTPSFKRILKKNADLEIKVLPLSFQQDHYDLFESYIQHRHADGDMYPATPSQYQQFLVAGLDTSRLLEFRLDNQLVGCCVFDTFSIGPSAMYTWFDVAHDKRFIGTLAILHLIQWAESKHLPHVYLGYWIAGSQKMAYKSRFQPLQTFKNDLWS